MIGRMIMSSLSSSFCKDIILPTSPSIRRTFPANLQQNTPITAYNCSPTCNKSRLRHQNRDINLQQITWRYQNRDTNLQQNR